MTEIYIHIVARMADYMATHPYDYETHWISNSGHIGFQVLLLSLRVLPSVVAHRSSGVQNSRTDWALNDKTPLRGEPCAVLARLLFKCSDHLLQH